MKVITFSRFFQSSHPRKGEPTYFVEKILRGIEVDDYWKWFFNENKDVPVEYITEFTRKFNYPNQDIKHHTIRGGNRFKEGEWFSPRIWSDKPYKSKQIIIAPPLQVKKTFDFKVDELGVASIDGTYYFPKEDETELYGYIELAKNDGLSAEDFHNWIIHPSYKKKQKFEGQIICWNENITYESEY